METSISDQELVEEVRDALAGLDTTKIPDATIVQAKDRFVEPILNELTSNPDQDQFDHAVVAWTAEKSFDAWLAFTRLRDRELEAYVNPRDYKKALVERSDNSLYVLGATRPPQVPSTVVTVKHDGENRRVRLDKEWVTVD